MVSNSLVTLLFQALLPGILARMILEVRCPRARMILEVRCPRDAVVVFTFLLTSVLLLAATVQARLESHVFTLDEPTQRMRPQVRVKESLDCLMSLSPHFHLFLVHLMPIIHVTGCRHLHVHARLGLLLLVLVLLLVFCPVSSSSAESAVVHAHATSLHNAQNSWSDTGRVYLSHGEEVHQRWGFRSGRRFASCLRGGGRGKFSAGRRCTGAGCRFTFQEATRHRNQANQGGCGHTFPPPRRFLVSNFVSPGRGLDIRQSMGWTKVCGTARSGIWVLKGNARARMLS